MLINNGRNRPARWYQKIFHYNCVGRGEDCTDIVCSVVPSFCLNDMNWIVRCIGTIKTAYIFKPESKTFYGISEKVARTDLFNSLDLRHKTSLTADLCKRGPILTGWKTSRYITKPIVPGELCVLYTQCRWDTWQANIEYRQYRYVILEKNLDAVSLFIALSGIIYMA